MPSRQHCRASFNIRDDILVHGRTQAEHDDNLRKMFERVRSSNITPSRENCVFNQRHLSFFGHVRRPERGYTSRSIPDFATITEPLRKLPRPKVTWEWGEEQEESLKKLHDLLQSQRVMTYCDPTKYTELIMDASPVGLGAILAQNEPED